MPCFSDETPFVAFGNDELSEKPSLVGNTIQCPTCGEQHEVMYGTDKDGKTSFMLGFYKCGEKAYLCTVNGKLVM